MQIVEAEPEHLPEIARIYEAEVISSPATFDIEPPTADDWERALAGLNRNRGHFLVVALDDDGAVIGYAKSGPFRDRAAYDLTAETSIYMAEAARGRGVGTTLYARLLELMEDSPALVAVGIMTEPNPASAALHESLGFTRVGTFEGVGVKFGKRWDVTWYHRSVA